MAKFKPIERICKQCGKEFVAKRKWHEFCCSDCRITHWKTRHPSITPDVLEDIKEIKNRLGIK